ncbi:hypothetical protein ACIBM4_18625 [Streptomyces sp. NPDC050256]|uniref:hypothetical protein n=1 Tax=Streptomyces sp. NPDC050256 TaxID=3365607 RepID=UPI0037B16EF3
MKYRIASLAAVAALVIGGATACGKAGDETPPTPTLTGAEGVVSAAASPSQTADETDGSSELKQGQKITVTTEDGPAEITLLAVHKTTSVGTTKPDAGTQWVIYSMQVKNLGTSGEWDTSWLESPRWVGSNGEADSPVFVAGPTDPQLIPYDPFSSTPEPRPGEHIKATEILQVPNVSGTLQFEYNSGTAHFDVIIK